MLKLPNVALALVLSAPFGLAIHDELTEKTPSIDELQHSSYGGLMNELYDYEDYEDDSYDPYDSGSLTDEEIARLLRQSGYDLQDTEEAEPEEVYRALTPEALRELIGNGPATLGPTLGDARFGMSRDQLLEAVPTLESPALGDPDMFPDVIVFPIYRDDTGTHLTGLGIVLPDPDGSVEQYLRTTWGEPRLAGDPLEQRMLVWLGADSQVRARFSYEDRSLRELVISQVMTVDQLFARPKLGKGVFSFETRPALLGASIDQLRASYDGVSTDAYDPESAYLGIPGIATDPLGRNRIDMFLTVNQGKVTRVLLDLPCMETDCPDVVQAMTRRFGKPTPIQTDNGEALRFSKSPQVTLLVLPGDNMAEVLVTSDRP